MGTPSTKMKHTVNVTAMVLIGLVSVATNLFAASLTVNPPLVMNDYAGQVSLTISGLTPGKTVLVERFIDANGNGVVDAGDALTFSFKVTDGQVPLIGGVRNPNVPGDDDGATNGSIRVDLPFPNVDEVFGSAAVKFIFRVSDPQNGFSPVTATFDVQQHVQPQGSLVRSRRRPVAHHCQSVCVAGCSQRIANRGCAYGR